MSTSITLKELSKLLGVSISTISKALNDSHEISESTKQRIREMAELHNYQPNKLAVSLKSGKTRTIGVIIPSIQNYFFAQVLFGIEKVIADSDYNIIVSITHESLEKETKAVTTFSNGLVDGIIVALAEETQLARESSHFDTALNLKKPVVMFDRVFKDFPCDKVQVNDYQVVFDAVQQLQARGRKHIILVSTIQNLSVGKSRAKGYADAVSKEVQLEGTPETIDKVLGDYMSKHSVDGIIALDEDASLTALSVTKKLKKSIPEEVAIIGYASEKMAMNLSPTLTTLNQHGGIIGEKTAKILLEKLKIGAKTLTNEAVETTLVSRETF
ncbi:LacI family DNA-binding transcriptional regulator [Flavobacteriaceae bacterium S356]|uniref:LacI family DNA-binding transcriptional regulator n=1 Tax=Asprobacillus argus TaxID=3076534 RepID=A0ABU3LBZ2_9FLAO|nr:LacI family DNA-binding transcriptional regulator [Flavobacteriaceae bacterium S356]